MTDPPDANHGSYQVLARRYRSRSFAELVGQEAIIRTLGNAGDIEGARALFEQLPKPRPQAVWKEMLRLCNQCGETSFAMHAQT